MNNRVQLTTTLQTELTRYFAVICGGLTVQQLKTRIDTNSLIRYARFRIAGDGDSIRTADLVARDSMIARDNSYVRVCHGP